MNAAADNETFISERKKERYLNIMRLYEAGFSIRKISRTLKYSRNTVSKYINGDMASICTTELTSGVDRYRDYIIKALSQGICRSNIYRELVKQGLQCGKTATYDYMNRLAEIHGIDVSIMKDATTAQKERQKQIRKYDYLSRKAVFRYLWMGEELEQRHLAYLYDTYPKFRMLQTCIMEWRQIFRMGYQSLLYSFLDKYCDSEIKQIAGFVNGLMKDQEAVENAVSSSLSNGFVEGTNSKLKMVKRTMYGRCSRQLLAAKLMLDV